MTVQFFAVPFHQQLFELSLHTYANCLLRKDTDRARCLGIWFRQESEGLDTYKPMPSSTSWARLLARFAGLWSPAVSGAGHHGSAFCAEEARRANAAKPRFVVIGLEYLHSVPRRPDFLMKEHTRLVLTGGSSKIEPHLQRRLHEYSAYPV